MPVPLLIPTFADPYYQERVTLDGSDYVLRFAFSSREASWYLSLDDSEGNLLQSGIKLVCNYPLFKDSPVANLPPGELVCYAAPDGDTSPPARAELGKGKRCELIYYPVT